MNLNSKVSQLLKWFLLWISSLYKIANWLHKSELINWLSILQGLTPKDSYRSGEHEWTGIHHQVRMNEQDAPSPFLAYAWCWEDFLMGFTFSFLN